MITQRIYSAFWLVLVWEIFDGAEMLVTDPSASAEQRIALPDAALAGVRLPRFCALVSDRILFLAVRALCRGWLSTD